MKKTLLLLFIVHCQLSIVNSFAQTNVSGFINSNTTWTLAGSPYIVVGNALVSQGYTLTIDPGVVVKFDTMKALQIDGTLIAIGTAANRITFTSSSASPVRGSWAKLHFSAYSTNAVYDASGNYQSGCIMKYCDVMYGGGLGYGEVHIEGAEPYISQCNIKNSSSAGIYCSGSSCLVDSSSVSDNVDYGFYFYQYFQNSCGLLISGDTINNNSNGGIYLVSGSLLCNTAIKNCHFKFNNGNGAINNYTHNNVSIYSCFFENNNSSIGIVSLAEGYGPYSNIKIENNYFGYNNSSYQTLSLRGVNTDNIYINVKGNNFINNISGAGIIGTGVGTPMQRDTISCNVFMNNQMHGSVIEFQSAYSPYNDGIIQYNIFDGNINLNISKPCVLSVSQQSNYNDLDFSHNIVRNNTTGTGILCRIFCNLSDSIELLKIHHNEFKNNTAGKILYFTGYQTNNSTRDFLYLRHNNFFDSGTEYTIFDSIPYGSPNIHADTNYWGSTATSHIDSIIYDYFDFANQSVVYYMPILPNPESIDTTCPPSFTTAINEVEKQTEGFTIYPNPAHNSFTISLNQWTVDNGQLTMYDIAGRCVGFESLSHQSEVIVNENFSPGVYFIKVTSGEKSETKKLIIQ